MDYDEKEKMNKLTNILGASLLALNSANLDAKETQQYQMDIGDKAQVTYTTDRSNYCINSVESKDMMNFYDTNCDGFFDTIQLETGEKALLGENKLPVFPWLYDGAQTHYISTQVAPALEDTIDDVNGRIESIRGLTSGNSSKKLIKKLLNSLGNQNYDSNQYKEAQRIADEIDSWKENK